MRPNTRILPRSFFAGSAVEVARALIGCVLVHETEAGTTAGRIVETEAYDETEPASHSSHGRTQRTEVMFGPGGYAYVYRSYGMHWCINVSVGPAGFGAAVLFRAIEPTVGLDIMAGRRGLPADEKNRLLLARGPGRLTQALGILGTHNGVDLLAGGLRLEADPAFASEIIATPRIGITKALALPWRFCVANSPYVSGPRRHLRTHAA